MPTVDLTPYQQPQNSTSDGSKFDNLIAAIQAAFNGGIDDANIAVAAGIALSKLAGYPSDVTKIPRGDGTWAVGGMYRIGDTTLGAPAATIDFPAIAATFSQLRLVGSVVAAGGPLAQLRFNGDSTAAHYQWQYVVGALTTAGAGDSTSATAIQVGDNSIGATSPAVFDIVIPNYAATVLNKSVVGTIYSIAGATPFASTFGGSWLSTAAINDVTLSLSGGASFAVGSRVTLYGMV